VSGLECYSCPSYCRSVVTWFSSCWSVVTLEWSEIMGRYKGEGPVWLLV